MKFKIKEITGIGYFALVKHRWFNKWKRIGKHIDGFGLYDGNSMSHPMNCSDTASNRCLLYEAWYNKVTSKPRYSKPSKEIHK